MEPTALYVAPQRRAKRAEAPPPQRALEDESPFWLIPMRATYDRFFALYGPPVLRGSHMNCQGGSWTHAKMVERLQVADTDWCAHSRGEAADGYYWFACTQETMFGVVGLHRDADIFVHRAYFSPQTPLSLASRAVAASVREFVSCRPEQQSVWAQVASVAGEQIFESAGYVCIYRGIPMRRRKSHRTRTTTVMGLSLPAAKARLQEQNGRRPNTALPHTKKCVRHGGSAQLSP